MSGWWDSLVLTFVPLFVALDAIGNLPFVMALTEGMPPRERRRTVNIAIIGATLVGLGFLFLGRFILSVLGIAFGAFAIAGGIILLVLSVKHMTTGYWVELEKEDTVAIVPIGTPLLVGPATITTLLLLSSQFHIGFVLASFILNMLLSWVIFRAGAQIMRFLGQGGLRAVSRVLDLLLAAIAVSMVIRGLSEVGIIRLAG